MSKRAPKAKPLAANVDDLILFGKPGITMPSDWTIAKVLWIDRAEMLVEHIPAGATEPVRQVLEVEYIRATGSISDLTHFRNAACLQVATLSRKVRETECALGNARQAVWDKLDELALQREAGA